MINLTSFSHNVLQQTKIILQLAAAKNMTREDLSRLVDDALLSHVSAAKDGQSPRKNIRTCPKCGQGKVVRLQLNKTRCTMVSGYLYLDFCDSCGWENYS